MAPRIRTDSSPSLNMMANDAKNAISGAICPLPVTRRSDSSRFRSIAITASCTSA